MNTCYVAIQRKGEWDLHACTRDIQRELMKLNTFKIRELTQAERKVARKLNAMGKLDWINPSDLGKILRWARKEEGK